MTDRSRRGSRRRFLAGLSTAALLGTVGCTGDDPGSGSDVQDSDGDGMIDSEDYAPQDPDVQEKSDVAAGDGGAGETAETGGDGTGGADDGGGGTDGADGGGAGGAGATTYPSHSGTHAVSARDNYWAWEFAVDAEFVLEYTATNLLDENYDFDVLLYDPSSFEEYRAIANEVEEGIRPQYLDGSAPGVTSGVEATVTLPAGTYYLVVDNTDLSDAGDWGTEETRRVRVEAATRAP